MATGNLDPYCRTNWLRTSTSLLLFLAWKGLTMKS